MLRDDVHRSRVLGKFGGVSRPRHVKLLVASSISLESRISSRFSLSCFLLRSCFPSSLSLSRRSIKSQQHSELIFPMTDASFPSAQLRWIPISLLHSLQLCLLESTVGSRLLPHLAIIRSAVGRSHSGPLSPTHVIYTALLALTGLPLYKLSSLCTWQ